jgi:hypothetical protein
MQLTFLYRHLLFDDEIQHFLLSHFARFGS